MKKNTSLLPLCLLARNRALPVFQSSKTRPGIAVLLTTLITKLIGFSSVLYVLTSCSVPEHLSPAELQRFVADEKHGLTSALELNGYSVKVTYRPSDLWIHEEVNGLVLDSATFLSLNGKYSGNYYFILSLSKDKHEALSPTQAGMAQYSAFLETLSFRMDEHVGLITASQDTIPVRDFVLDRTYGLNNTTNLLFSFSKDKCSKQEWVEFTMNEFGLGIGAQRFRFKLKDLEGAPRLKFEVGSKQAGA